MKKILVATQKPFAAVARQRLEAAAVEEGLTVEYLEKYPDEEALCAAVADADALIVRSDTVSARVAGEARQLKIVVRAGAGYDNLDLEALKAAGIVAMNTPGQNANGVAELAISQIIFMSRNCYAPGSGFEIEGKTLGLHGFGAVARLVGRKAAALGMRVRAYDPYVAPEVMQAAGVEPATSLEDLYGASYAVSIHVPALPSTIGCVNASLLSRMSGPRCILVNTARAEVVNDDDMFAAMKANPGLCYVTDVVKADKWARFASEFGTRAWADPVKIGAQTEESNVRAAEAAVRQISAFFKSGDTKFQLNR